MSGEIFFTNMLATNMCVDLRGRNIAVPQHFLKNAQVSSPFEQMCGEAVPERVRVQALEPDIAPIALDKLAYAPPGEPSTSHVQEDGIGVLI